jgi:hypothetical protein
MRKSLKSFFLICILHGRFTTMLICLKCLSDSGCHKIKSAGEWTTSQTGNDQTGI